MSQGRQRHPYQQQGGNEQRRHQVEDDAGRLRVTS